jgi:crotonobetainyl-CoA:carnitine CoA-transferase CaiB-like acyl-CoA transferase
MEILQKVGVMAGACLTLEELKNDRQLKEREFLLDIEQPLTGKLCLSRVPWRLSDTPGGNYYRAPLLGEHNDYVFGELLDMPEQEIRQLVEEKVIY